MATAAFVILLASVTMSIVLPIALSSTESKAAKDKARARRLAEHKMNARLLRFNL